jgi:hypothetical protein
VVEQVVEARNAPEHAGNGLVVLPDAPAHLSPPLVLALGSAGALSSIVFRTIL